MRVIQNEHARINNFLYGTAFKEIQPFFWRINIRGAFKTQAKIYDGFFQPRHQRIFSLEEKSEKEFLKLLWGGGWVYFLRKLSIEYTPHVVLTMLR